jgi:hypothetical protein
LIQTHSNDKDIPSSIRKKLPVINPNSTASPAEKPNGRLKTHIR